jgi:hypothetical protein
MTTRNLLGALSLLALGVIAPGCRNNAVSCDPACPTGTTCCEVSDGVACIDTLSDAHHCGACGNACGPFEVCGLGHCMLGDAGPRDGGTDGGPHDGGPRDMGPPDTGGLLCSPSCASSFMCCDTQCVLVVGVGPGADGRGNPSFMNCGTCGNACDAMTATRCGLPRGVSTGTPSCLCDNTHCTAGDLCLLVGGAYICTNPETDPMHCGSPPVACAPGEDCVMGACTCPPAGHTCPMGQVCGAAGCIDTQTDPMNCGTVGHACGAGENCMGGTCHCGSGAACTPPSGLACGTVCCGGACVPHLADRCGSCGTVCGDTEECGITFTMPAAGVHCAAPGAPFFFTCPMGTVRQPDSGVIDSGVAMDAGTDAGDVDAGMDAGDVDGGVDAGVDTGM